MSQKVYDILKPTGTFWVAQSKDIEANGESLENFLPIIVTPEEYNILYFHNGKIEYNGEMISYDANKIYLIKAIPTEDQKCAVCGNKIEN